MNSMIYRAIAHVCKEFLEYVSVLDSLEVRSEINVLLK